MAATMLDCFYNNLNALGMNRAVFDYLASRTNVYFIGPVVEHSMSGHRIDVSKLPTIDLFVYNKRSREVIIEYLENNGYGSSHDLVGNIYTLNFESTTLGHTNATTAAIRIVYPNRYYSRYKDDDSFTLEIIKSYARAIQSKPVFFNDHTFGFTGGEVCYTPTIIYSSDHTITSPSRIRGLPLSGKEQTTVDFSQISAWI